MGLDQYAWACEKRPETDTDFSEDGMITDADHPDCFVKDKVFGDLFVCKPGFKALAYWRKHPNLHGAIEVIYRRKRGANFNLDSFHGGVVLDLADIEELEKLALADELPETTGFFFGQSGDWHKAPTFEFFKRAREEIARGWTVIYTTSW